LPTGALEGIRRGNRATATPCRPRTTLGCPLGPRSRASAACRDHFSRARQSLIFRPTLTRRLAVACCSRELAAFVDARPELWPAVEAVAETGGPPEEAARLEGALGWAAARTRVRRLRVALRDDARAERRLAGAPAFEERAGAAVAALGAALSASVALASLDLELPSGPAALPDRARPAFGRALAAALSAGAGPTLRQLSVRAWAVELPPSAGAAFSRLEALALDAASGRGARLPRGCLPRGLVRLRLSGLAEPELPPALQDLDGRLEVLELRWADGPAAALDAAGPDLSLLAAPGPRAWCGALRVLAVAVPGAAALPAALPRGLEALTLKWGAAAASAAWRKGSRFDRDPFHASCAALAPLESLTHLCLNNAVGGWGLPPAVAALTRLESLGVAGSAPGDAAWGRAAAALPPQLTRLARLRRLDIEIIEAADGWAELAKLTSLEYLRLGRGGAPEEYAAAAPAISAGLAALLPALPALKEVSTEGMLLPATRTGGRWARLGGGAPGPAAADAAAALAARGVALRRWYSQASEGTRAGWTAWDEV
jgi:hypothetical protein